MPLISGARLGSYVISGPLGAGGMGEVYRARDIRLNRDVAIKVLPDAFAQTPDRLSRFTREAQTLAALNHPNIAQIHGLVELPPEAGSENGLVMEFVDGEDLSQMISRGPVPLDESLGIARQIAAALEAAHAQGIIHRDLKPANLKRHRDGTVKVLDFGLAKAPDPRSGSHASSDPTLTAHATESGTIVGTAAYMAPEQARGRPVDQRADIWAFGCVLYELLTGKRAFRGDDFATVVSSVLTSDPDWTALPPGTPPPIRRLLRRCLVKDPARRLRHIGDAALEIDDAAADPPAGADAAAPPRSYRRRLVAVAMMVVAGAAGLLIGWRAHPAIESTERRVEISTPPSENLSSLAISPDGNSVAFVANDNGRAKLWVRPMDADTARPLPGTEGAFLPFWSPDSRSIGFFSDDGKLKRIDVEGGAILDLAGSRVARGGTWREDHTILFVPRTGGVARVADTGGAVTTVTRLEAKQSSHALPYSLPGGTHFLYYVVGERDVRGVYVAALDGTGARRLVESDTAAVGMSNGCLLFVRDSRLFAQRFDAQRLELAGEPRQIASGVARQRIPVDESAAISTSVRGDIVFRGGGVRQERQFVWVARSGAEISRIGSADDGGAASPALSPDGRRIALTRGRDGNVDVFLLDVDRGGFTRFTSNPANDIQPLWSPDGTRILFASNRSGAYQLYEKSTRGAADERLVLDTRAWPTDWSRDGKYVLLQHVGDESSDIWVLPIGDNQKPRAIVETRFDEADPQFSPDGAWLAFSSTESGRAEVYVQPFPGGAKVPVSLNGGAQARWRQDGKELFFIALDGRLMAAPISLPTTAGGTVEVGAPVALFTTHISGAVQFASRTQYMVSPDGSRFLMNTLIPQSTPSPIVVLMNWKPPRI